MAGIFYAYSNQKVCREYTTFELQSLVALLQKMRLAGGLPLLQPAHASAHLAQRPLERVDDGGEAAVVQRRRGRVDGVRSVDIIFVVVVVGGGSGVVVHRTPLARHQRWRQAGHEGGRLHRIAGGADRRAARFAVQPGAQIDRGNVGALAIAALLKKQKNKTKRLGVGHFFVSEVGDGSKPWLDMTWEWEFKGLPIWPEKHFELHPSFLVFRLRHLDNLIEKAGLKSGKMLPIKK